MARIYLQCIFLLTFFRKVDVDTISQSLTEWTISLNNVLCGFKVRENDGH